LLLVFAGDEGWAGTTGVPAAGWGPREAWKVNDHELFMLQDRTTLITDVRNKILNLIEREDDTRSWDNFLIYFSHNVIPT
jgi:hypothetical protein